MRKHITLFDTRKHHIHLECCLTDVHGILYSVAGTVDTGAPQFEFSDQFWYMPDFSNQDVRKLSYLRVYRLTNMES